MFRVNSYIGIVTLLRLHTVIVAGNCSVIQHFGAKPAMDTMPLLRQTLLANNSPIEDQLIQAVAGPVPV